MNYPAPTIVPITASWKPNLAFRLMVSPEQARDWVRYTKFRNYRDRTGKPVRYGHPAADEEIARLRNHIDRLHRTITSWAIADGEAAK